MEEILKPWVISGKDAEGNGRATLFKTATVEQAAANFQILNPDFEITHMEEHLMKGRK